MSKHKIADDGWWLRVEASEITTLVKSTHLNNGLSSWAIFVAMFSKILCDWSMQIQIPYAATTHMFGEANANTLFVIFKSLVCLHKHTHEV